MARAGSRSAGLLLHHDGPEGPVVLLAHMGGPFWRGKDERAWSIPKGEPLDGEDDLAAARREFTEELGLPVPAGRLVDLGEVRQASGKAVRAWALEADLDPGAVVPGTFTLELPRGSGRMVEFPEVDRVAWLSVPEARPRIVAAQAAFLDRLAALTSS